MHQHRAESSAAAPARRLVVIALVIVSACRRPGCRPASGAGSQRLFVSLDQAAQALVDAMRRRRPESAILAILGEDAKGTDLVRGRGYQTAASRERFVTAYDEKHRFEGGGGKVVLVLGL